MPPTCSCLTTKLHPNLTLHGRRTSHPWQAISRLQKNPKRQPTQSKAQSGYRRTSPEPELSRPKPYPYRLTTTKNQIAIATREQRNPAPQTGRGIHARGDGRKTRRRRRRRRRVTCFGPRLELPAAEELLAVLGDCGAAARVLPALVHPPPTPSGDLPSAAAAAAALGFASLARRRRAEMNPSRAEQAEPGREREQRGLAVWYFETRESRAASLRKKTSYFRI